MLPTSGIRCYLHIPMLETKKIIEDYIDEVSNSLAFIASESCQALCHESKRKFFRKL